MYAFVYQCNLSVYVSCFIVYIKILFKWCAQTNPWLQYWLAFDNSSNFLRVPMELMEFNKYCKILNGTSITKNKLYANA